MTLPARPILLHVVREARDRGLLDPPPYSDEKARECWQVGYEMAIKDLLDGKIGAYRVTS